jgi:DNA helicase-2/ATP-dependent DNA helicase PcrA
MLYGRTTANPLSPFVRRELPQELLHIDGERKIPPRSTYNPYSGWGSTSREGASSYQRERSPSRSYQQQSYPPSYERDARTPTPRPKAPSTPESYGVKEYPVGTRVSHSIFGEGTITASRVMGGDVLYTVNFDKSGEKRLMATYAKLTKI